MLLVHLFVCLVRVGFCHFSLPLGVGIWLWFVVVTLPRLFYCFFVNSFMFSTWAQSLVITLLKKGNLQLCQNYRTISLISHPSKVMLKVILNRLQPQAEEIIAEEQAGFTAGRSTTEQILISGSSASHTCNISRISTISS